MGDHEDFLFGEVVNFGSLWKISETLEEVFKNPIFRSLTVFPRTAGVNMLNIARKSANIRTFLAKLIRTESF